MIRRHGEAPHVTDEFRAEIDRRRRDAGLSWAALADQIGGDPVHVTAALLGQHPLSEDQAQRAVAVLGLEPEHVATLTEIPPERIGARLEIPADPTLYRFYEALGVYGPALRLLLHEEFGDGIMSAINFKAAIRRIPDPEGDRVEVTFNGKFLKYQW
jgi:cyanate lyase